MSFRGEGDWTRSSTGPFPTSMANVTSEGAVAKQERMKTIVSVLQTQACSGCLGKINVHQCGEDISGLPGALGSPSALSTAKDKNACVLYTVHLSCSWSLSCSWFFNTGSRNLWHLYLSESLLRLLVSLVYPGFTCVQLYTRG